MFYGLLWISIPTREIILIYIMLHTKATPPFPLNNLGTNWSTSVTRKGPDKCHAIIWIEFKEKIVRMISQQGCYINFSLVNACTK